MIGVAIGSMSAGELALRLCTLRGTAAYAAYLATSDDIELALVELEEELRALDPDAKIARMSPRGGEQLVSDLTGAAAEIILVDGRSFSMRDWALIDRRRASIAHRGLLVFATTPESFNELMRIAPNLASWLGGQVFAYPRDEAAIAAHRERRLASLRAWASRTDLEILDAARAGTLPPDPEYAEWLVLLGHGELLGPARHD
jgi:hypothetical protein